MLKTSEILTDGPFSYLKLAIRALVRSLRLGHVHYRAASLSYISLVSIVPGLAVTFSLLNTFGQQEQLRPVLLNLLHPLGPESQILVNQLLDSARAVNVGILGFFGILSLLWMIFSMVGGIESAFNEIWRVRSSGSSFRRIGEFLSLALLGPVLVFSGVGLVIERIEPFLTSEFDPRVKEFLQPMFTWSSHVVSVLLVSGIFTLVYLYIPRTRVDWRAALFGGLLGGCGWKITGYWFGTFIVQSASYHAMYSTILIFILFLMWLQFSWMALLIGGEASMYFQNPHRLHGDFEFKDLPRPEQDAITLSILALINDAFCRQGDEWTLARLSESTSAPSDMVLTCVDQLKAAGFLDETNRNPATYIPARELSSMTIAVVLENLAQANQDAQSGWRHKKFGVPGIRTWLEAKDESEIKNTPLGALLKALPAHDD